MRSNRLGRGLKRTFVATLALFQLAFTGGLAVADAWIESHSSDVAAVHVEPKGEGQHAPLHTSDCVVCHQITGWGNGRPATPLVFSFTQTVKAVAEQNSNELFPSQQSHTTSLPRAPPRNLSF